MAIAVFESGEGFGIHAGGHLHGWEAGVGDSSEWWGSVGMMEEGLAYSAAIEVVGVCLDLNCPLTGVACLLSTDGNCPLTRMSCVVGASC